MTRNMDATVFVYRSHKDKTIKAEYIDKARLLEDSPDWEHIATLEPRMWIECHYKKIEDEQRREALKLALEALDKHDYEMADHILWKALAQQCVCGEPNSAGTHRTDGPCLAPQRKPLTDEEYSALAEQYTGADGLDCVDYGRAIARHYGIKG